MHDIRWIRENATEFDKALNRRPLDEESKKLFSSANLLAIDERRRAAITKSEVAQARRNAASKEIGQVKAKKDEAAAQKLMAEVKPACTGRALVISEMPSSSRRWAPRAS